MTRATTPTLVPLDFFAQYLGLSGMHFAGATAPDAPNDIFADHNTCSNVWPQYTWQTPKQVSREDLAYTLFDAEEKIKAELNFALAPHWEIYHPAQPDNKGKAYLGEGKIITPGQRATTLLATVTTAGGDMVFSDADSDGYDETVTLTVTVASGQDPKEVKVYYAGHLADESWEIFPRTLTISGTTATITLWSWQVINPALWEAFPVDANYKAINLSTPPTNCVTSLDVYRVYTDTTQPSVVFYWGKSQDTCANCDGTGCAVCSEISQNGCFEILDRENGWVKPYPASYNSDTGQWERTTFSVGRRPDTVYFYYYAGDRSQRYLKNETLWPFDQRLARAAIMLAVAGLARPFCSCANVNSLVDEWQRNPAFDEASNLPFAVFENCPWGRKEGQLQAWDIVQNYKPKIKAWGVTIP